MKTLSIKAKDVLFLKYCMNSFMKAGSDEELAAKMPIYSAISKAGTLLPEGNIADMSLDIELEDASFTWLEKGWPSILKTFKRRDPFDPKILMDGITTEEDSLTYMAIKEALTN